MTIPTAAARRTMATCSPAARRSMVMYSLSRTAMTSRALQGVPACACTGIGRSGAWASPSRSSRCWTLNQNGVVSVFGQPRYFATMSEDELKKRMDEFQDLFVEARLCIEDAQESQETTYFAEDLDAAQEAVDEAVSAFEKIIEDIEGKDQKNSVLRSNGLKVEQLKGEIQMIIDGHGHHH